MTDKIIAKSRFITHNLPYGWRFTPVVNLIVDDRETGGYIGDLNYEHTGYTIRLAIRIKDWIFALEKINPAHRVFMNARGFVLPSPELWFLAGFHGNDHYNFDSSRDEPVNTWFVSKVVREFVPHLCVDLFDGKVGEPTELIQHMQFEIPSAQEMIMTQLTQEEIQKGTLQSSHRVKT